MLDRLAGCAVLGFLYVKSMAIKALTVELDAGRGRLRTAGLLFSVPNIQ